MDMQRHLPEQSLCHTDWILPSIILSILQLQSASHPEGCSQAYLPINPSHAHLACISLFPRCTVRLHPQPPKHCSSPAASSSCICIRVIDVNLQSRAGIASHALCTLHKLSCKRGPTETWKSTLFLWVRNTGSTML